MIHIGSLGFPVSIFFIKEYVLEPSNACREPASDASHRSLFAHTVYSQALYCPIMSSHALIFLELWINYGISNGMAKAFRFIRSIGRMALLQI